MRVVAPMSVNGRSDMLMTRAFTPSPSVKSMRKSSIAGYRNSSTAFGSRWISSMKSTDRSSALVRYGITSLGAARAAPLAIWKPTPRSRGMHMAKVVFPRPGGPSKRMCPSGSPRFDGRIDRDFQPRVHFPLSDHVLHVLRAQVAVLIVELRGRLQNGFPCHKHTV